MTDLDMEMSRLQAAMLAAGARWADSHTEADFAAFSEAARAYVKAHRRWWAIHHPDIAYESMFGGDDEQG